MLGGLCFIVNGKMHIGTKPKRVVVRFDTARYEGLIEKEGCEPMNIKGKEMKGFALLIQKC